MKHIRNRHGRIHFKDGKCPVLALTLFFLVMSALSLPAPVPAEEISAAAAVVIDASSERILYAKNPHLKLPPASTTKLVTAMVVLDRIHPDSIVTVSANAADVPSVAPHLRQNERITVRNLLHLALMRSVNGATVALAEAVAGSEDAFAALMNEKVQHIGAHNTRFINASGLPGPGQHITAFDLTKVMKEALTYPLIREIVSTRTKKVYTQGGRGLFVKNTNNLLWTDDDVVGGKTGYTKAARHCFVCAAQRGESMLITAVLGEAAREGLWEESTDLLAKGYDVVTERARPVIYVKDSSERPFVLASYAPAKADRKVSKAEKSRGKKTSVAAADRKKTTVKAKTKGGTTSKKAATKKSGTKQPKSRQLHARNGSVPDNS